MITRKVTTKIDNTQIDALIHSLESQSYSPSCSQAQVLVQSTTLPFYFANVHQHITSSNLQTIKRYEVIPDGLYILLKGQVSLMFNSNQEKDLNKTKTNQFKGTVNISKSLSLFQCSFKNCTALQQTYLLKIEQEQAVSSKFYQLYNRRKDLYDNHYLPSNHQNIQDTNRFGSVFSTDISLHSNFIFYKFIFRQTVSLPSIAIIAQGKVRPKIKQNFNQIQKYGVLLPNMTYEVTSASLEVMLIKSNESLVMKILEESPKQIKNTPTKNKGLRHMRAKCSTYKHQSKVSSMSLFNKKDKAKRQRQLTKISKQSQSYSIISSFLCHKSLDMINKQCKTESNKSRKEDRCKNPLILFNIVNQKSRLATPNFPNVTACASVCQQSRSKKIEMQSKQNFSNRNLLRKLRLPLHEYQRMQKKNSFEPKKVEIRSDCKAKSLFTLTSGKQTYEPFQEDVFVRYQHQC